MFILILLFYKFYIVVFNNKMKYLVIYIILVFLLYTYLKYYCYNDQQNILNSNKNTNLNSDNLKSNTNRAELPSSEPYSFVPFVPFKSFHSNLSSLVYDDYEDIYNKKLNNEYYSNEIHWKSFGTDISSDTVKQKKAQFREIESPNITIEKYNSIENKIYNNIPFLINTNTITKQDRNEIAMANLIVPKVIETYDNVTGERKVKSFGLVMKKQFKSVNNLSKTFRSIRFKSDIQLPKEFNGPQIWKDYLSPITDQGKCGNCWAHASSSVLADRFAILSLGKIKFTPSPYELTICSFDFQNVDIKNVWKNKEELEKMDKRMHENRSCNGNNLYDTATTLFTDGVTEVSCFPNKFNVNGKNIDIGSSENTNDFPYCYNVTGIELDTCVDGKTPMRKYRCKTAYVCSKENDDITLKERKLMYDLYKYGPIIVGFMLFPDFVYDYDGKSIYTHADKSGGDLGGHAVRLVGWGEETVNGQLIKYWWIANSWGKDWGINGYFRMKRCMPEIQLEENIMSIIPDFPGMSIDDPNLEAVESEKDKEIKNYTGHTLDSTTGYYNTSIEKLKKCEFRGKMFPYISNSFIQYLPKYKEFFAAKVTEHISSNNINNIPYNNDIPTYYCSQDYTPSPESNNTNIVDVTNNKNDSQNKEKTKDNSTIKSASTSTNTSNNTSTGSNDSNETESNLHKYTCKVVNYKYFDIIYIIIAIIIGIIIYFTFYSNNNSSSASKDLNNTSETSTKEDSTNTSDTNQIINMPLMTPSPTTSDNNQMINMPLMTPS